MENKLLSEHKRKLKFPTLAAVIFIGVASLGAVAMAGAVFFLYLNGQTITWFEGLSTIGVGLLLGGFNAICIARFMRRMLPVRKVLLFENDQIEIVSWRDKKITAKLPDNIKHIAVIGADFSVTFKIEKRYFVVSSEDFSDKDGINTYFRNFVERCSVKIG
jgi:hypothetical protein